ncbi:MAG: hypothetical protein ACMUIE_06190 [Thermoplasmatota archaeon]
MNRRTLAAAAITTLLVPVILGLIGISIADPPRSNSPFFFNERVDPQMGDTNTLFTFTTWYADLDGDAPRYVRLHIDGTHYLMSTQASSPDYMRGVNYTYATNLSAGTHYYYYFANNTVNQTVRSPLSGYYHINVSSPVPTLSYGTHSPSRPDTSTGVNFTVRYKAPNATAPTYVRLHISGYDNTMNMTYNMTSTGSNYMVGVHFVKYLQLPNGSYHYWFTSDNVWGDALRNPSSGYYFIHVPNATTNTNPWVRSVYFHPSSPVMGENMTFVASYQDVDNDPPQFVQLVYSKVGGGNPTHVINMTVNGTDYKNGVYCYAAITAPSNGTYNFHYYTKDSKGNPDWSSMYSFTVGNKTHSPPYLSSPGIYPTSPVNNQTVSFSILYNDPSGNIQPDLVRFHLIKDGVTHIWNMTKGNTSRTSTHYYFNIKLASGKYSYYFDAHAGNSTLRYPSGGYLYLNISQPPPPNNAPTLTRIGFTPSLPQAGQNITFTAIYSDNDNDAPYHIRLFIGPHSWNGTPVAQYFQQYNMTLSSRDYVNGVQASVVLVLAQGSYKYYLVAGSPGHTVTVPSSSFYYFNVTASSSPDNAPVLYSPGISNTFPKPNQSVTFSIYYKDREGDPPTYVRIHFLWGAGANYINYTMNSPSTLYHQGVRFTYSLSLSLGTYYYYFTTASGNNTVTYPASGTLSVSVQNPPPPPDNRSRASLSMDPDGNLRIDVTTEQEGLTLTVISSNKKEFKIQISSDDPVDRVIIFDLDKSVLDIKDLDDLELLLDNMKIRRASLEEIEAGNSEIALYHIEETETGYRITLFIPETRSHLLSALVADDETAKGPSSSIWIVLIAVIITAIVLGVFGISMLTSAQKRKKEEAFYDDFELHAKTDGIIGGSLSRNEDIDWDDIIE